MRFTLPMAILATAFVSTACLDLDDLFAECDGDSDCDDDEECDDGECVELECTEDSDCDPGEECNSDECERIDCVGDEECGEGAFCDVTIGKCDEIPSGEGEGEGEGEEGEGEGEGEEGEGEGEGEGDPCDGIPADGQCNGDIIERCNFGSVETFNCNSAPFPSGQTTCQFVNAVDRVDCAVQSGSQCILEGGTAVALCQGSSGGCRLEDTTSGTCDSTATTCSTSDEFQCIGDLFILDCTDESGFGDGQPLFIDCAFSGGSCVDNVGCLIEDGGFCTPDITQCGDSFSPTTCPSNGICPGGGGTFTHSTGIPGDAPFTNDTPSDTSSQQGAIDACNAHFGVTTCGVACGGSCTTVTLNAECSCNADFVWHFGESGCFVSTDAPGMVTGDNCSSTVVGNWN